MTGECPFSICTFCAIGTDNLGNGAWFGTEKMDFLQTETNPGVRRIVSVWFPCLPTDRLKRKTKGEPLSDAPLAVSAKLGNTLAIYALNVSASQLGLRKGQPLANAIAMVPQLRVVEADLEADAKLLGGIANWCDRFTPYIAFDGTDGLLLDVTGVTHLFGSETKMLRTMETLFAKQGLAAAIAIASTAVAAWAFSHFAAGTIATPGREPEALSSLPVEALNSSSDILYALRRAGLKTIGQVAARQRSELTARFGKEFATSLEHALGKSEKPISPRRPIPNFMAERQFAEPITASSVVAETLHSLAETLCTVLEKRGLGARQLDAAFFRSDGQLLRLSVQTGNPTRKPELIDRLFQLKLDSLADPLDPGFGFDLIRLEARLTQSPFGDVTAFEEEDQAKNEISQLVDRLSVRFGAHRIMRFEAQDTHIPEAASVAVPAQSAIHTGIAWQRRTAPREMPRRPLRLFRKPEPISVVAEIPDGPPLRFRWRNSLHTAAFAAGPETIEMEWWRHNEAMPARDYFRVEDDKGRRYWLFREGKYAGQNKNLQWFIHGVFA